MILDIRYCFPPKSGSLYHFQTPSSGPSMPDDKALENCCWRIEENLAQAGSQYVSIQRYEIGYEI